MKNLYYLLLLFLLLSPSCLKEEENLFSEPPAERIDKALSEYKSVLASSEKGWLLEYYPHPEQIYGGWNFVMKFTTSSVTAYSEIFGDPTEEYESLYQLISDDGPVLSFDTYNDFLHFFSTPSGSQYQAYQGDYEFIIMGMSDDKNEIQLKGKKTGNKMVLRRISENPESYLTKVMETEEKIEASSYTLHVNGKVFDCYLDDRVLSFEYTDVNNEVVVVEVAYCVTDKGIRLYEPTEIDGITVQEFLADDTHLTSLDGKIIINYHFIPVNEDFVNSIPKTTYYLFDSASNLLDVCDAMKTWNQTITSLAYASAYRLTYLRLTMTYYSSNPSFMFYASQTSGSVFQFIYGYKISIVNGTEDKVKFESTVSNLNANASLTPFFISEFIAKILAEETYILTPDKRVKPNEYKFTSERDPNIWFYIYK
ncbi:MAG: DUF4302 domain-containing protein [Prevotella sp.]|jgi:hypothetical protein|nr:DUF4302 domain-containing protein [Prevotella sp.]